MSFTFGSSIRRVVHVLKDRVHGHTTVTFDPTNPDDQISTDDNGRPLSDPFSVSWLVSQFPGVDQYQTQSQLEVASVQVFQQSPTMIELKMQLFPGRRFSNNTPIESILPGNLFPCIKHDLAEQEKYLEGLQKSIIEVIQGGKPSQSVFNLQQAFFIPISLKVQVPMNVAAGPAKMCLSASIVEHVAVAVAETSLANKITTLDITTSFSDEAQIVALSNLVNTRLSLISLWKIFFDMGMSLGEWEGLTSDGIATYKLVNTGNQAGTTNNSSSSSSSNGNSSTSIFSSTASTSNAKDKGKNPDNSCISTIFGPTPKDDEKMEG